MNFFRKVWEKVKPEPQKPDEELSDLLLKLNNIHKINKVLYPASGFDANHIISSFPFNIEMITLDPGYTTKSTNPLVKVNHGKLLVENAKFQDNLFDLIISEMPYTWMQITETNEVYRAKIKNIIRMLKPNGFLVICGPSYSGYIGGHMNWPSVYSSANRIFHELPKIVSPNKRWCAFILTQKFKEKIMQEELVAK